MNSNDSILNQNLLAKLVALFVGGTMYAAMVLHQTINAQPEFYIAKLDQADATLVEHGRALQKQLDALVCSEPTDTNWFATITEDQLNGWLIGELPERFPQLLAAGMRDPRVVIEPDRIRVACQYRSGNMQAVLTLEVEAFLTDKPNELGFRILETKIGAVPGLTDKALAAITRACRRAQVHIRWADREEQPVLIVTVPSSLVNPKHEMNLESFELAEGELSVAVLLVPTETPPVLVRSIRTGRRNVGPSELTHRAGLVAKTKVTSQPASKKFELPELTVLNDR